ncbi:MAG TPA: Rieske 2Fe-2S domain-containing protein [Rhodocyclaceae bacterium]|jgi:3-phenylpropionate/trans-cinnamate dioxygenase ferredoxin subunit|nr:Rieske 2Fe-2S domain-containing protein [Rhodocyclaceae bacterium]
MADLCDQPKHSPLASSARLRIETAGGPIALFDVAGVVHAIEDGCLRCGSSLATGAVEGTMVVCRTCGWRYDLASGGVVGLPALRLSTYAVRACACADPVERAT